MKVLAAALTLLLAVGVVAAAAETWSIAEQSDKSIRTLVAAYQKEYGGADIGGGAPAIYLAHREEVQARDFDHQICHNRLLEVVDVGRTEYATQTLSFPAGAKITSAAAFILRADGSLVRVAEELIQQRPGDDSVGPQFTCHFPAIEAGDILGWSAVVDCDWEYRGRSHVPAAVEYPVRYRQIRVSSSGAEAFRIIAYNVERGKGGNHVYRSEGEVATDMCVIFRDLGVWQDSYAAPPYALRNPYCTIYSAAYSRLNAAGKRILFPYASWNWAVFAVERGLFRHWEKHGYELTSVARQRAGYGDESVRLANLHRFVRDEFVPIDPGEAGADSRTPGRILAARNATHWEKGLLLAYLARSLSIPVDIVFVRSHDYGLPDNSLIGLGQFSDIVVRKQGTTDQYYAPSFAECPPGILPVSLRGAPAMLVADGLTEKLEEIEKATFAELGYDVAFEGEVLARVSRQKWHTRFSTPGDPDAVSGSVQETLVYEAATGHWRLEVESAGFTPLLAAARELADPQDVVTDYLSRRYPVDVADARTVHADADSCWYSYQARLEQAAPPAQGGDTWVLAPADVYGLCDFDAWTGPDRGPFYFDNTWSWRRTWSVPLPAGWQGVALPPPVKVEHPRFVFDARVFVAERQLVVERMLVYRRGLTRVKDLAGLDEAIVTMQQAERSPLVLRRLDQ